MEVAQIAKVRDGRRLQVDTDTERIQWVRCPQFNCLGLGGSDRISFDEVDELEPYQLSQSTANIYYQSDRSLLTAL